MTAEVYEWGNDKVLKLYFKWFKEEWIKREKEISHTINTADIPSPAVCGLIEEEERKGIVYERIYGTSMLNLIIKKPWYTVHYAREMARIHNNIHNFHVDELPNQNKRLEAAILESSQLLGDKTEKIINYLNTLPQSNCVCHGDFHPDNILICAKEAKVIDWFNASSGNPLGDVARTCLIIRTPYMPPGISKLIIKISRIIKHFIYSSYIKKYIKISKSNVEDIDKWMLPIAAARLRDKVPGEEKWLLDIIIKEYEKIHTN